MSFQMSHSTYHLPLFSPQAFWLILLILFLALLTEFIGVIAQSIGASRRYDGPIGKRPSLYFWYARTAR